MNKVRNDRERDNYNYDIRHTWEDRDVKKHFNMMNRNPDYMDCILLED